MLLAMMKSRFETDLQALYPKTEIRAFFYAVVEAYLGENKFVLATNPQYHLTKKQQDYFLQVLSRLKQEEPIQYILGRAFFRGMNLQVNTEVLIPRPETEELVTLAVSHMRSESPISVLDVGTGSGAIAISVAKEAPEAKLIALELSSKALEIAKRNAKEQGVAIQFLHADVLGLGAVLEGHVFDYIISNPPYVRDVEKKQLANNVKQYEPGMALFVPNDDPLVFYRAIGVLGLKHLAPGGSLFLEINQCMGLETLELLKELGYRNSALKKDIFENHRFIHAQKS